MLYAISLITINVLLYGVTCAASLYYFARVRTMHARLLAWGSILMTVGSTLSMFFKYGMRERMFAYPEELRMALLTFAFSLAFFGSTIFITGFCLLVKRAASIKQQ